jgi:hypothetical protein
LYDPSDNPTPEVMMQSQRRKSTVAIVTTALTATLAVGLLASSLIAAQPTASLAPTSDATDEARGTKTPYALTGFSFGSRLIGGEIPAESGRTAYSLLGCTKSAGLKDKNAVADIKVGDFGAVSGISSRTWTTQSGDKVSSQSQTKIGAIELGQGDAKLVIEGVTLKTKAWHDSTGFHKSGSAKILTIKAKVGGVSVPIPANPTPGQHIKVPGLAEITILGGTSSQSAHHAQITRRALRIELSDGSTLVVGTSRSGINDKAPAGLLNGWGRAASANVLETAVTTGNIAVQPLKCTGTDGDWSSNKTAGIEVPGVIDISAASGSAKGSQRDARNASAHTRGRIAHVMLSDQLEIGGIEAHARVAKKDGKLTTSIKGTTVAYIKAAGESFAVPDPGQSISIPGIAKITVAKKFPGKYGVRVVAVEVKLFDGDLATINLGEAFARIKPR